MSLINASQQSTSFALYKSYCHNRRCSLYHLWYTVPSVKRRQPVPLTRQTSRSKATAARRRTRAAAMVMASASNAKKKKKNAKKSAKRKPVNLQSNFNRKCKSDAAVAAGVTQAVTAYESISADMFPANHHHHHSDDDEHHHTHHNDNDSGDAAGDCSCGDFHLHRYAVLAMLVSSMAPIVANLTLLSRFTASAATGSSSRAT